MIRQIKPSKMGHRELSVPVVRTPDHARFDQLAAHGPQRGRRTLEYFGDFTEAVRAGPQVRHGAQATVLRRGQAIEAGAEEALIEGSRGDLGGVVKVLGCDRGTFGQIPGRLAPLLQEIGLALGLFYDALEGTCFKGDTLSPRWKDERSSGVLGSEGINAGKVEEPFRIGLRLSDATTEMGQACAHGSDRQLTLGDPVQRRDQRSQLFLAHVQELIDEEHNGGLRSSGGFAGGLQ